MRKTLLLLLFVSNFILSNASNTFTADSVKNIISNLEAANNFIEKLDISKKCNLPIGVKKTIANAEFILAISRIEYKKTMRKLI